MAKFLPLLLAGSLAANAAMLATFAVRPALAPASIRDFFVSDAARATQIAAENRAEQTRRAARVRAAAVEAERRRARLWSTLDSTDLASLIANLRAAGFSPVVVRAVVSARLEARFASRMSELVGSVDVPFWKPEPFSSIQNPKFYEAQSQIYRERTRALRDLLGDDYFAGSAGEATAEQRRKFGDLPKAKIDLVQRIVDDYAEMIAQVRVATQGITLPEDRQKFALLEREKRADLAAILSPAELEDFEMRNSPVLTRARGALTIMNATEEEFRAIYRAQQPYADVLYPSSSSGFSAELSRQRTEAQQKVAAELRQSLGEARYADYNRASSYDYQNLFRLAQREGLTTDTINRAYDLRATAAQESMRIQEARMGLAERNAAMQALAASTRAKLIGNLGANLGETYAKSASWLSALERGYAIRFGPDGSSTTFYSPPNPAPAPLIKKSPGP